MGLQKCILNLNRANRELQPHGTPEFPIAGYAADYTHKEEDVIPWHWHAEMEILYVGSGGLKLQIPGKTFHLKQGEGFVINSNILHFAAAEPACSLHSLVFHPLLVAGSEDSVFGTRYIAPLIQCLSLIHISHRPENRYSFLLNTISSSPPPDVRIQPTDMLTGG